MSLKSFFSSSAIIPENKKVIISNRFVENGKPIEWELRAITEDENSKIRNACTHTTKFKGQSTTEFDKNRYLAKLCAASVVFPDLKDAELQKSYGVVGDGEVLMAMLLPGEFETLAEIAQDMNGFNLEQFEEKKEEVKNS